MIVIRSIWNTVIFTISFIFILISTANYFFGLADVFEKVSRIVTNYISL
jgi:hypothetical protein